MLSIEPRLTIEPRLIAPLRLTVISRKVIDTRIEINTCHQLPGFYINVEPEVPRHLIALLHYQRGVLPEIKQFRESLSRPCCQHSNCFRLVHDQIKQHNQVSQTIIEPITCTFVASLSTHNSLSSPSALLLHGGD